jgi:uncharacterized protein YlzI (FlbEa/FlbD family)
MSNSQKIEYHKERGDVIIKFDNSKMIITKEKINSNIEKYKNIYNNCYYYEDMERAIKFIFKFENLCTIVRNDEAYDCSNAFYLTIA